MKELSIEEKAKAYDEAIERAKEINREHSKKGFKPSDDVLYIFPELAESKEERIRNFISNELACLRAADEKGTVRYNELTEAISWLEKQIEKDEEILILKDQIESLHAAIVAVKETHRIELEKQGDKKDICATCDHSMLNCQNFPCDEKRDEQKPTDKVEPKFKVGDTVKDPYGDTYHITEITNDSYKTDDGRFILFTNEDAYRLWTIQDAKDGDVLANDISVFIYAKVLYSNPYAYCGVDKFGVFKDNCLKYNWSNSVDNIHPATKEQRGLLFQKMHEAGYEWDADKKELKKIEQKPTEDVDLPEFESYLCLMFQKFRTKGMCTNGEIIDYINEHSQKLRDILVKPAWGEEDEKELSRVIYMMEQLDLTESWSDCYTFLNSLKDRVQLQPKQEWSEDDEEALDYIIAYIEKNKSKDTIYTKKTEVLEGLIEQLKSLKERYTWKPSDVQMSAIKDAIDYLGGNTKIVRKHLMSLYDQLKKLKE